MKTMAQKAGLEPNVKSHFGRKTMTQNLVNNGVSPTDIMQLSGHKNVQSILSYSTVSQKKKQLNITYMLTGLSLGERAPQSALVLQRKESRNLTSSLIQHVELSKACKQVAQQPLSLFWVLLSE